MKRWLFSISLLFMLNIIQGQHLHTTHFTLENGLKGLEIYAMALAPDGKLWFQSGTDYFGIYDGIDFEFIPADTFNIRSYVASMSFFDSTLWIGTSEKKIIALNKEDIKIYSGPGARIYSVEKDIFARDPGNRNLMKWDQEKDSFFIFHPEIAPATELFPIRENFYIEPPEPYHEFKTRYLELEQYKNKQDLTLNYRYNLTTYQYTTTKNQILGISKEGYFISMNPNAILVEKIEDEDSFKTSILQEISTNIANRRFRTRQKYEYLLSSTPQGNNLNLYQLEDNQFLKKGPTNLESMQTFEIDQTGNIWVGNHNGLYKINPHLLFISSSDKNMVGALHAIAEDELGNIWFGGYKTGLAYFDGTEIHQAPKTNKMGGQQFMPGSLSDQGTMYFPLAEGFQLLKIENGKKSFHKLIVDKERQLTASDYIVRKLRNGKLAFGLNKYGLGIAENIEEENLVLKTIGKNKGLLIENVITIAEDQKGRVWCGRSSKGVSLYDPVLDTAYSWMITSEDPTSFGTMSSKKDRKGNLWLGTNKGLYFLENPHLFDPEENLFDYAKYIPFPDLDRSLVASMEEVGPYIVAGNATAVHFIHLDSFYLSKDPPLIHSLWYGRDIDGDGTEQNCFLVDSKGYLWIGSQSGATRMDIKNYQFDTTKVKITIKDIIAGQSSINIDSTQIIIPKDNRNLSFKIRPVNNPSLLNNIFYSYALINRKGDTLTSALHVNQPEIRLSYMPPGKYTLSIQAYKNGRLADIYNTAIIAPRSLSENPFYWAGMIGTGLLAVIGFIIYRNKAQKRILRQKLRLSELQNDRDNLQIQAIISSFNPHFINNSLHWAQSRYKHDPTLVKLIGRLSKNIQYILLTTRTGRAFHTLEKEMELVKNYITIQKIRFEDSFEVRMPEAETFEKYKNFNLLLMQLQIHIENAIEHGLRNRIESSFVKLEIEEDAHYLHFKITDDGIGRNKAKQQKSGGTQNGTSMLKELHQIFNHKNDLPIQRKYIDEPFEDKVTGEKYGTIVIISIPKNYQYELEKT